MNRIPGPFNSDTLYYSLNVCNKVKQSSYLKQCIKGKNKWWWFFCAFGLCIPLYYMYMYTYVYMCNDDIFYFMCDDKFHYAKMGDSGIK